MTDPNSVTPEFQEQYEKLDASTIVLAHSILEQVSKNDVRLLKKMNIRLTKFIEEIKTLS